MFNGWFQWFILFWIFLLPTLLGIGGFFMFRKFLKSLPKKDGKSDLDWEIYYVEKTKDLWDRETLSLLEELVSPVPKPFRDVARQKIQGKIGEIALSQQKMVVHAIEAGAKDFIVKPFDETNLIETIEKNIVD